ncbi:MAG: hypothetical protein ACRC9Z_10310 [Weissella confusa]
MPYLEERVEELENHIQRQDVIINKLMEMVSKSNQGQLLDLSQAYFKLTGKANSTGSAKSQYMGHLVKDGYIHKILIGGRPKFDPSELDEFIESRKVTGRLV